MSNSIKFLITLALGVGLFIFVLGMVGAGRVIEALSILVSFKGATLLILSLISGMMSVIKWRQIIKALAPENHYKTSDILRLWFAGFSLNYLTPIAVAGGEPFRIVGLRKKYDISWSKSVASVFVERILDWTFFLVTTVLGIFTLLFFGQFLSLRLISLIVTTVMVLLGFLMFFYAKVLRKESALEAILKFFGIKKHRIENSSNGNMIFEVEREIIRFFSGVKKVLWQGFALTFLKYALDFSRVWLLFYFLTGDINFLKSFAVYGFSNLAMLIPVPATLGSLEATGLISFKNLGAGMNLGAVYAMVLRSVDLIITLVGIVFLIRLSLGFTLDKFFSFIDVVKNKKNNDQQGAG